MMKRLALYVAVVSLVTTGVGTAAYADIPTNSDYMMVYHLDQETLLPIWEYLPGTTYYYGVPTLNYDPLYYWWGIPNQSKPGWFKSVVWEVEWEQGYNPFTQFGGPWEDPFFLYSPWGLQNPSPGVYNPANNSLTWHWTIPMQPDWENIRWLNYTQYQPSNPLYQRYRWYNRWFVDLEHVNKIEVATVCWDPTVPEPGCLATLLCGLAGFGGFIVSRRR